MKKRPGWVPEYRPGMTAFKIGSWYRCQFEAIRAERLAAGLPYSLRQWAEDRQEDYQYVRSLVALTFALRPAGPGE